MVLEIAGSLRAHPLCLGAHDATLSQGIVLVANSGAISSLVSEDEFLDFAGGGAGDGSEDEAGGDFVGGEMLTTPLLQLLGAKLRASGEFDEGAGDFAPLGVRYGDDGGYGDGGVFVKCFFDFYRGYVSRRRR